MPATTRRRLDDTTHRTLLAQVRRRGREAAAVVAELPDPGALYSGALAEIVGCLRAFRDAEELVAACYLERPALVTWAQCAVDGTALPPLLALDAAVWRRLRQLGAAEE
jgi:hypothetical protein